jgi:hypothetical protein
MQRLGGGVLALVLLRGLMAWGAKGPTEAPQESWLSILKPCREKPPVLFSYLRHPMPP